MYKKIIAIVLSCVMLVSISPAVAAEDAPAEPKPTVEEILNEYHRKSFETQLSTETDATTYSNRSGESSKTLEQETVDTLTAAGYEAYNVNSENFDSLETSLATNFEQMGLQKDSSYIIVIGGDELAPSSQSQSRVKPGPMQDIIDDGGSDPNRFTFTYNGKTYSMRYVTVTSNENPEYHSGNTAELSSEYISSFGERFLQTVFLLGLDYATKPFPTSAVYSLLGLDSLNEYTVGDDPMSFHGTATWVRTFIQIWDNDRGWVTAQSSAYVTAGSYCSGYVHNRITGNTTPTTGPEELRTIYSPQYFDKEQCKADAVNAYLSYCVETDATGGVDFSHEGTHLFTLYEEYGMEPIFP